MSEPKTIRIDNTEYVRADSVPAAIPNGSRVVVVVDRGWIYAGDVEERDGRIYLTRAVWVFNWSGVGFDGVLKDPKSSKVQIRKMDHMVDIPADSEIFRVPVSDDWGL